VLFTIACIAGMVAKGILSEKIIKRFFESPFFSLEKIRQAVALASSFRYNPSHLEVYHGHAAGKGGRVRQFRFLAG
jgi:hypothetical protein